MKKDDLVKLIISVPETHVDQIIDLLLELKVGKMGDYEGCSFVYEGTGVFRPLKGATPAVGKVGKVSKVKEVKIDTFCEKKRVDEVISAIKKAHPYEEPIIEISANKYV